MSDLSRSAAFVATHQRHLAQYRTLGCVNEPFVDHSGARGFAAARTD